MNEIKNIKSPPKADPPSAEKSKIQNPKAPAECQGNHNFIFSSFIFDSNPRGVTLLLVILILSALLSISITIFDSVIGELRIAGEITDSFLALYAADQGMEKILYENRVSGTVCPGSARSCVYGPRTFGPNYPNLPPGACFKVKLERRGENITIVSTGEYNCLNRNPDEEIGSVKRAFQSSYSNQ